MAIDPLFELALAIKAAQRELERLSNEAMWPLGLTGAQADALVVIEKAGHMSLKELGELVIAESGHPSRLVDRLVEIDLVERAPSPEDRRRVVLTLTPAGRQRVKKVHQARAEVIELARGLLGKRDTGPTLKLLREMLQFTPYGELLARRAELGA